MSQGAFQIERDRNVGIVDFRGSLRDREILFEITNELGEILAEIESDSRIHVVILKGVESENPDEPWGFIDRLTLEDVPLASLTRCVSRMNRPVIAELNGRIFGLGMELALACDIRVAGEESSFCLPHVHRGLMPWNGGTQTLPRLVGTAKAMELILMGEPINAQEALRIGLVNRVVDGKSLSEAVLKMAHEMASRSPISLEYCKEAIIKGMDLTIEQGLRLEADLYFLMHTTHDREEGIKAFQEKRKPEFNGN